jgi:hypothetical protein
MSITARNPQILLKFLVVDPKRANNFDCRFPTEELKKWTQLYSSIVSTSPLP